VLDAGVQWAANLSDSEREVTATVMAAVTVPTLASLRRRRPASDARTAEFRSQHRAKARIATSRELCELAEQGGTSMTRRHVLKLGGAILAALGVLRPVRAFARATPPADSAFERMKQLRMDYILAKGNPKKRLPSTAKSSPLASK
jgi:hypothetical protein